jgi:hypothetical protein
MSMSMSMSMSKRVRVCGRIGGFVVSNPAIGYREHETHKFATLRKLDNVSQGPKKRDIGCPARSAYRASKRACMPEHASIIGHAQFSLEMYLRKWAWPRGYGQERTKLASIIVVVAE